MGYVEAHDPRVLRYYEGLVFQTARKVVGSSEEELEDIQQILRVKLYRALLASDPAKLRPKIGESLHQARDRYVYMCLADQVKDLVKKRKRGELLIEDLSTGEHDGEQLSSRDRFDERYLSSSHDEVYGRVDDEDCLIPNTLSELEQEIVLLLYRDFKQSEIARRLGMEKREMERSMRSIRQKLADWRPAVIATENGGRRYSPKRPETSTTRRARQAPAL